MNFYELMFIIKPDIEGEELEEAITRVKEVLEKEGSVVELVKKIGKRRLAYEINDIKDGYYVLLNVQAEPGIVPALEHFFRVTEGYLRYMVIRLDDQKQKEVNVEPQAEPQEEVVEEAKEEIVDEENNDIDKTAVVDE
jgi:small subunit ribosomal protein S6